MSSSRGGDTNYIHRAPPLLSQSDRSNKSKLLKLVDVNPPRAQKTIRYHNNYNYCWPPPAPPPQPQHFNSCDSDATRSTSISTSFANPSNTQSQISSPERGVTTPTSPSGLDSNGNSFAWTTGFDGDRGDVPNKPNQYNYYPQPAAVQQCNNLSGYSTWGRERSDNIRPFGQKYVNVNEHETINKKSYESREDHMPVHRYVGQEQDKSYIQQQRELVEPSKQNKSSSSDGPSTYTIECNCCLKPLRVTCSAKSLAGLAGIVPEHVIEGKTSEEERELQMMNDFQYAEALAQEDASVKGLADTLPKHVVERETREVEQNLQLLNDLQYAEALAQESVFGKVSESVALQQVAMLGNEVDDEETMMRIATQMSLEASQKSVEQRDDASKMPLSESTPATGVYGTRKERYGSYGSPTPPQQQYQQQQQQEIVSPTHITSNNNDEEEMWDLKQDDRNEHQNSHYDNQNLRNGYENHRNWNQNFRNEKQNPRNRDLRNPRIQLFNENQQNNNYSFGENVDGSAERFGTGTGGFGQQSNSSGFGQPFDTSGFGFGQPFNCPERQRMQQGQMIQQQVQDVKEEDVEDLDSNERRKLAELEKQFERFSTYPAVTVVCCVKDESGLNTMDERSCQLFEEISKSSTLDQLLNSMALDPPPRDRRAFIDGEKIEQFGGGRYTDDDDDEVEKEDEEEENLKTVDTQDSIFANIPSPREVFKSLPSRSLIRTVSCEEGLDDLYGDDQSVLHLYSAQRYDKEAPIELSVEESLRTGWFDASVENFEPYEPSDFRSPYSEMAAESFDSLSIDSCRSSFNLDSDAEDGEEEACEWTYGLLIEFGPVEDCEDGLMYTTAEVYTMRYGRQYITIRGDTIDPELRTTVLIKYAMKKNNTYVIRPSKIRGIGLTGCMKMRLDRMLSLKVFAISANMNCSFRDCVQQQQRVPVWCDQVGLIYVNPQPVKQGRDRTPALFGDQLFQPLALVQLTIEIEHKKDPNYPMDNSCWRVSQIGQIVDDQAHSTSVTPSNFWPVECIRLDDLHVIEQNGGIMKDLIILRSEKYPDWQIWTRQMHSSVEDEYRNMRLTAVVAPVVTGAMQGSYMALVVGPIQVIARLTMDRIFNFIPKAHGYKPKPTNPKLIRAVRNVKLPTRSSRRLC